MLLKVTIICILKITWLFRQYALNSKSKPPLKAIGLHDNRKAAVWPPNWHQAASRTAVKLIHFGVNGNTKPSSLSSLRKKITHLLKRIWFEKVLCVLLLSLIYTELLVCKFNCFFQFFQTSAADGTRSHFWYTCLSDVSFGLTNADVESSWFTAAYPQ